MILLPAALHLRDLQSNNETSNASTVIIAADQPDIEWGFGDDEDNGFTPEQKEQVWCKVKSRGIQLTKAMMMNDRDAASLLQWPYTESPWGGDLKSELRKWGYKETNNEDDQIDAACDFDNTHEVGDAFKEIKVDPRPAGQGGPNHCFYVEHMNGPTVIPDEDGEIPFEEDQYYYADGKKYRVTQGYAKVGVNPVDGLVYFIHRQSPEDAAEEHWQRKPNANELPALRASSDIAWGMWNRVVQGSQKLNYFMAVQIVNAESHFIMKRAIEQFNIKEVPPWPGKDFEFAVKGKDPSGNVPDDDLLEMEAALALLGSPNGLAAGYFLIQHRRQLGWKYIWKVKIWMAGEGEWANPNLLLYVSNHAPLAGPQTLDDQLNRLHIAQKRKRDPGSTIVAPVVHTSSDGKNVIREHRVIARL
ncbi:Mitochondrial import inner membrane translocase subunit tim8 [Didymella sp. IMI 355093]|nr:Mitochondrial import inner membrane translocase subunit tim8 [Didymella sp. IMI 355093]